MQITYSKITVAIIAVLLIASTTLMALPVHGQDGQAHGGAPQAQITGTTGPLASGLSPNITITTDPYLSFSPNPIGVGQTLLVNVWLHPPIHVQRSLPGLVVTMRPPQGTPIVIGPMNSYQGDTSAWFEWVVDQVGTWKLKFEFQGCYYPSGNYLSGIAYDTPRTVLGVNSVFLESAYYKPSATPELELTVQQDMVMSYPPSALPNDYWTRPASPLNREWWPVLGNYPPDGIVGGTTNWPANTNKYMSNYEFLPYTIGPESAHVVWKRPYGIGGLIGGSAGQLSNVVGGGLTGSGYPTIVYSGRGYDAYAKPGSGRTTTTYWRCYDIRTGEVFWERALETGESAPTFIEYHAQGAEVPGATARTGKTVYLVALVSPTSSAAGRILKYDPWTGALSLNLTGPPSGVGAGTIYAYPYVFSVQTIGSGATAQYRLLNWTLENNAGQWRTAGGGSQLTVDNFTARIYGNVSWPFSSVGTCDFERMISVVTQGISSSGTGVNIGQRLMAANLITGGTVPMWNITTDTSTGLETFFSAGIGVADQGLYANRMQNGQIYAWSLTSGQLVWKSELTGWPWGVFGSYDVQSAYGLLFSNAYDGVHAINWTNGKVEWSFKAPAAPFETPYNGEQVWHSAGKVADGKLYTFNTEHTPSQPLTRGWRLFCLNATTGANIWNIALGQGIPGSRYFQGSIADGYLAHTNEYDGYLYVFGKGKSTTTVTASPAAIMSGTPVVIQGTVLDMSPAQPGAACVSKDSMATYMEYLHMQQPIDGIYHNVTVTGVPVKILAINSGGTAIDIGTVTSDSSGTFSTAWTPPSAGFYKITASFLGDESYSSSWAETTVSVTQAPPQPEPEPETPVDNMPLFYGMAVVAIAVILAIAIATILILKKR